MGTEEIDPGGEQGLADVIAGEIMASKGRGDEEVRIEFANIFPQEFEIFKGDEPMGPDGAFVAEVEIPIAMAFEGEDESRDGTAMRGQIRQQFPGAGEGDVDDQATAVGFGHEGLEFGEEGFA